MMTIRKAMTIFAQSRSFYHCWRNLGTRNADALRGRLFNLYGEPRLIAQNVNSRYMALANNLAISETHLRTFFNHLIDAYTRGSRTEFENILNQQSVKKLINNRIQIFENIESLAELGKEDKEMKKLAEEEQINNENQLKQIDEELAKIILENLGGNNYDNIILEITAGVGGQEAMLFLKDLLNMYTKHLSYLGYDFDIIELDDAEQGGIRHASVMICGKDAFRKLKHEAGVHRVQRIPSTDKSARIHTSVVSVAILPQPNEIEIEINPKDLRIDTMRASGAGGQHVNTTNSAVRITHLPTGTVAECQTNRSQIKNRELAMCKLRARLYQKKLEAQLEGATNMRKQQMGMGERNEKIRTYNFLQDRITDHRLSNGTMHNLKSFLDGGETLNNLHERLQEDLQYKMLLDAVKSVT